MKALCAFGTIAIGAVSLNWGIFCCFVTKTGTVFSFLAIVCIYRFRI